MFHPRLIAVVTALLMMSTASPGRAEYTLEQLERIESLIGSKNCAGLWSYVQANPGLTAGNDPLASELRVFVSSTERGQLDCFASRRVLNQTDGPAAPDDQPAAGSPLGLLVY